MAICGINPSLLSHAVLTPLGGWGRGYCLSASSRSIFPHFLCSAGGTRAVAVPAAVCQALLKQHSRSDKSLALSSELTVGWQCLGGHPAFNNAPVPWPASAPVDLVCCVILSLCRTSLLALLPVLRLPTRYQQQLSSTPVESSGSQALGL